MMPDFKTTPIVALDVPSIEAAQELVRALGDQCGFYKVGLELFAAEGPHVVKWLRSQRKEVFVDLKLHDIPNTVRSAARAVSALGASLLTAHASGGETMMRAAVEGAIEGGGDCGILAVTVLTSLDATGLAGVWGRDVDELNVGPEVMRLAGIAMAAKARGIVCSGQELSLIKETFGHGLDALVPGIRLPGGDTHDQARVMTPGTAARYGARWLVLGRAVTGAVDPADAMARVWGELGANR